MHEYRLYDPDKRLFYAGSRNGMAKWSTKPKMFATLGHLRQSLYQSRRYITGRMIIQTCDLVIVDARGVTQRDVNARA